MERQILATFTGKIIAITSGIVAAGAALLTTEAMKMETNQNSSVSGTFMAAVVVGAIVVAGETIIGSFTPTTEE